MDFIRRMVNYVYSLMYTTPVMPAVNITHNVNNADTGADNMLPKYGQNNPDPEVQHPTSSPFMQEFGELNVR
jgi:hypothetical protein